MRSAVTLLLDRDGTLIHDVPYCNDPDQVRPLPGVAQALGRLRARGVRMAIVSNQSGIARGVATVDQVERVRARVRELLGPFDLDLICPHGDEDHCGCRKPMPGLIHAALDSLGAEVEGAVLIGDIESDIKAARAAGVHGILVPTRSTQPSEIARASCVRTDFAAAAAHVLAFADTSRWEAA